MDEYLIADELRRFLEEKEFLYVATSDPGRQPNVAPKFLIKVDKDWVYLADFVIGKTVENLKHGPRVSLSIMDRDNLIGYILNGSAEIIRSGVEFDKLLKDLNKRQMHFSVERIIEGMAQNKKHKDFEASFPKKLIVIKVGVKEIVHIAPSGDVKRKIKTGEIESA